MSRELTLIVTDLHLAADGASMDSPPLEALELLLARAGSKRASEWRAWISGGVGIPLANPPVAAISRCASQPSGPGDWWVASPVYLEAGMDHIRLGRLLTLLPEEWLDLEAGLASALDPAVATFSGSDAAHAYLLAKRTLGVQTVDPARVIGTDVHGYLPSGPDAPSLKRVMTELQMWLHEHPLNARREQRGVPPVNGFWIWGGGSMPATVTAKARELPVLFSDDAYATGLWRLLGESPQPLPARLEAAATAASGNREMAIAVTLRQLAGVVDGERMRVLNQAWIAPALAMLRAGHLRTLKLHLNDRLFTVTSTDLWRMWRRRRPWLEAVG